MASLVVVVDEEEKEEDGDGGDEDMTSVGGEVAAVTVAACREEVALLSFLAFLGCRVLVVSPAHVMSARLRQVAAAAADLLQVRPAACRPGVQVFKVFAPVKPSSLPACVARADRQELQRGAPRVVP